MDDLVPLNDQLDTLTAGSTAMEIAGVWVSILANWFPPLEGYQIRLNPKTTWVEVYVLRIARAPRELEVTVNPAFVIRCYGPGSWNPIAARYCNGAKYQMALMVRGFCESIRAAVFPAHGAIAYKKEVRFVRYDWELCKMRSVHDMPGTFPVALDGLIPRHLDHIKANFAERWGYPYSEYWELSSCTEQNGSEAEDGTYAEDLGTRLDKDEVDVNDQDKS